MPKYVEIDPKDITRIGTDEQRRKIVASKSIGRVKIDGKKKAGSKNPEKN
jgi:hypothetical protein